MEEIEVKRNPLGIKVFVVGKPDIDHMTEDEEKEMFGYRREILDSIGLTRDTNPEKEDKK